MLYDNFVSLCEAAGISPTRVLTELGISRGSLTRWKDGGEPRNETKKQIADYFGITVAELMSEESGKTKKPATERDELVEVLQEFKDNPDLRTLFLLGKNATAEEVRQYINVIKALRGRTDE